MSRDTRHIPQFRSGGQSLIEVIVGLAIGAIVIGAAAAIMTVSIRSNVQTKQAGDGGAIGQALMDSVRVVAEMSWQRVYGIPTKGPETAYHVASPLPLTGTVSLTNGSPTVAGSGTRFTVELLAGDYVSFGGDGKGYRVASIASDSGLSLGAAYAGGTASGVSGAREFSVRSGEEEVTVNNVVYRRSFSVENVLRDASGAVVTSGGTDDPSTQKVLVRASWSPGGTEMQTATLDALLSRTKNTSTRFTNWGGGAMTETSAGTPLPGFSSAENIDFTTTPGALQLKLR